MRMESWGMILIALHFTGAHPSHPSWPGLSRPSTPSFARKKGVDARHKARHDVER
jgi:hypothetical protein